MNRIDRTLLKLQMLKQTEDFRLAGAETADKSLDFARGRRAGLRDAVELLQEAIEDEAPWS